MLNVHVTQDKKFVEQNFHQQDQVAKLAKIFGYTVYDKASMPVQ